MYRPAAMTSGDRMASKRAVLSCIVVVDDRAYLEMVESTSWRAGQSASAIVSAKILNAKRKP